MIYRQRNKKTGYKKYILIAVLFLALFFFGAFFKNIFQAVGNPILNLSSGTSSVFGNFTSYFKSKNELQKLNNELRQQNQDFKIELLTLQNLRQENNELKSQLNFVNTDRNFVTSKIITRPPFSPFDTFVINGNSQIQVGQKVFYKQLLIGRISEVYDTSAIVKLFSSSDEKIAIKMLDNNFEAEGQGNLSFKIRTPKSITVSENDPIYSAETDSVLGVVQSINSNEASAFQDIYFRYPISINDLTYVEIEI